MHWISLVLLSTFVAAGASVVDKRLMDGHAVHPSAAAASFGIVGFPVSAVGLMLLPPIPWQEALAGLVAGGLFIVAAWLYYEAVAREEISRLVPLFRLTALQTLLLGAVFLGDTLTRQQLAAFGVMLLSGLLLVLKPGAGRLTFSRAALRMLPVTTLLALNGILTAHVYRTASLWAGVVWENLGMGLGAGVLGVVWMSRRSTPGQGSIEKRDDGPQTTATLIVDRPSSIVRRPSSTRRWSLVVRPSSVSAWGVLILEQTFRLATGLAPAWAIAHGVPVGLVAALGGIRPAWVWLLAVWWLREPLNRREFLLKGGGMVGMGIGLRLLI